MASRAIRPLIERMAVGAVVSDSSYECICRLRCRSRVWLLVRLGVVGNECVRVRASYSRGYTTCAGRPPTFTSTFSRIVRGRRRSEVRVVSRSCGSLYVRCACIVQHLNGGACPGVAARIYTIHCKLDEINFAIFFSNASSRHHRV